MSNGRLVLENIMTYGVLVKFDMPLEFLYDPKAWPALLALICRWNISGFFNNMTHDKWKKKREYLRHELFYTFCAVYWKEIRKGNFWFFLFNCVCEFEIKKISFQLIKEQIKESHGNFLSILNIVTALLFPAIYLWYRKANPGEINFFCCKNIFKQ